MGSPAMASLRAVRPPRPSTADGRSDRVPFGGGGVASSAGVAEHVARARLRPTAGLEGRRGPTRRRLQGADENSQRQPGTATASPSTPRLNPAPSESHRGRRLRQGGRRHCGPVKENRSGSLCGVHGRPSSAHAPSLPRSPGGLGGPPAPVPSPSPVKSVSCWVLRESKVGVHQPAPRSPPIARRVFYFFPSQGATGRCSLFDPKAEGHLSPCMFFALD